MKSWLILHELNKSWIMRALKSTIFFFFLLISKNLTNHESWMHWNQLYNFFGKQKFNKSWIMSALKLNKSWIMSALKSTIFLSFDKEKLNKSWIMNALKSAIYLFFLLISKNLTNHECIEINYKFFLLINKNLTNRES